MAYAGSTRLSGSEASTLRVRVARVVKHPRYDPDTADFDAALLELAGPLRFGRHVQPVCLPAAAHVFPPGRKCLISGWGYLRLSHALSCIRGSHAGGQGPGCP